MSNMSYCVFENTYNDLEEALERLDTVEFEKLSKSEKRYRNKLVALCKEIADDFEQEEESDNKNLD